MNSPTPAVPMSPETQSDADRCQHRTPSGRRCRSACKDSRSRFCHPHDLAEQHRHNGDRANILLSHPNSFRSATGIGRTLGELYILLAEDRISPRRAAVLAYINSLQLRNLPEIRTENPPRVVFDLAPDEVGR